MIGLGALELWAAVPAGFALGLDPVVMAISAAAGAIVASAVVLLAGEWLRGETCPRT